MYVSDTMLAVAVNDIPGDFIGVQPETDVYGFK